jgi:hypothetical protein
MVFIIVEIMSTSCSQRQDNVFYIALGIKNDNQRQAFLERACTKDTAMLADIKELLAVQDDAERFFADLHHTLGVG